jgi:holliday junction DNA helicase RuvA
MYESISGKFLEMNPSYIVVEAGGIAFFIHISLHSYSQFADDKEGKLFVHQVVREDAQMLYGFYDKSERDLFRHLITVSGIGASTARMMLSSMSPEEIRQAILAEKVDVLKSVKGIGLKSAQRIIIELKSKISREPAGSEIFVSEDNTLREEALSALIMLGFSKAACEKIIGQLLKEKPGLVLEDLIKQALKRI